LTKDEEEDVLRRAFDFKVSGQRPEEDDRLRKNFRRQVEVEIKKIG